MQKLYETHKIVTYPRTDSRHITEDIVPTLPERLKSIAVGPYAEGARALLKGQDKDDQKVLLTTARSPTIMLSYPPSSI